MTYNLITKLHSVLPALLIALLLNACATPKAITINGNAAANVNPDNHGKPLSVVLHVYQLKSPESFNKLTFDDFMSGKTAAELIGDPLLADKEVILVPGGTASVAESVKPEAHYIGVIGFFRKPDEHMWRLLLNADDVRSKGLNLTAEECYLKANNIKPVAIPGQPATYSPSCQAFMQKAKQEEKHENYAKKYKYRHKPFIAKTKPKE